MADSPSPNPAGPAVIPAEGVTRAERYVAQLCKQSFLSIWSYPGVFRDQCRPGGKGDGKEVCDLLVVFENHIIIFSDKDCRFGSGGNLKTEWARWFKKAVRNSAKQVWERNDGSGSSPIDSSWIGNVRSHFQSIFPILPRQRFTESLSRTTPRVLSGRLSAAAEVSC